MSDPNFPEGSKEEHEYWTKPPGDGMSEQRVSDLPSGHEVDGFRAEHRLAAALAISELHRAGVLPDIDDDTLDKRLVPYVAQFIANWQRRGSDDCRAALAAAERELRELARVGDTLSPQEIINHVAAVLAVDRHEYPGDPRLANRSVIDLDIQLRRAEQLGAGCVALGAERTRERDAAVARAEAAEAAVLIMSEWSAHLSPRFKDLVAEIRARKEQL